MGKLNLGLDDRSARLIHGRDVWSEIRGLLSGYSAISAAIAFVGPDADKYLALRGPATIVVNAGDDALASGRTDPEVLLRWTRRGVRVYSLGSLHAKVLLAEGHPTFVLIGSADVLSTTGRILDEAVLVADERETVDELRDAIAGWRRRAGEPLTETWLQQAISRYHPAAPHRLPLAPADGSAPEGDDVDQSLPEPGIAVAHLDEVATEPELETDPASEPDEQEPSIADGALSDESTPAQDCVSASEDVQDSALAEDPEDPAVPRSESESHAETEPEAEPEVTEDSEREPDSAPANAAPVGEVAAATSSEQPESGQPTVLAESQKVDWPRPKYIYLAALTKDGRASDGAQERLEQLRAEHRVPADRNHPPTLEVDIFWWDEPARAAGKSSPTYREGWHVVPISVTGSGRPAVSSEVDSPGRVLSSYTDYSGGPARTYYYLLRHCGGASTTFRKLREALTAVGEKPSYNHAYMMQHKVDAILDLWPQIDYSE